MIVYQVEAFSGQPNPAPKRTASPHAWLYRICLSASF